MDQTRVLRCREVERLLQLSKGTIYRLIGRGTFPRPIRLDARAVGWRSDEIASWLDNRERAGLESCDE